MLTPHQISAINKARTALRQMEAEASRLAWNHAETDASPQDYGRIACAADAAEHSLFMVLNIASSHNITDLTPDQIHNRKTVDA